MKEVTEWDNRPRYMWCWDRNENEKRKEYVVHIISKEEMMEAHCSCLTCPVMTVSCNFSHCAEIEEPTKRRCTGEEFVEMLKKQGVGFLKNKLSGIRYSIDYFDNIAVVIDGEMHTYQGLCEDYSLLDGSELWVDDVPPECISPTPEEIGG